ncbi:MAG: hypothetical protein WDW38_004535 [Sanguina aurantia]
MSVAPATAVETVRGYLIIKVEEASGKNQAGDALVWETSAASPLEAFVKVEIRGGSKSLKAQTRKMVLAGEAQSISWREDLQLELLDSSTELRLMLCKEKFQGTKRGTSVIAACGIFVNDILDAVPIDKYFELFKPNGGGEGGFIRISMNFYKNASDIPTTDTIPSPALSAVPAIAEANHESTGRVEAVVLPESLDDVAPPAAVPSTPASAAEGPETVPAASSKASSSKSEQRKIPFIKLFMLSAVASAAVGFILKAKKS